METSRGFDWSTLDQDPPQAAPPRSWRAGAAVSAKEVREFVGRGATGGAFLALPVSMLFGTPFVSTAILSAVLCSLAWTLVSVGLRGQSRPSSCGLLLRLLAGLLATVFILAALFVFGVKLYLDGRAKDAPPPVYVPPAQVH
jgi:hypothetical protein